MRYVCLSVLLILLNGCSMLPEKPADVYQLAKMRSMQELRNWYFEGRLALTDAKDSVSASISWRHRLDRDDIELTGPLSQGRLLISVTPGRVVVDDGEKPQEYIGRADQVMSEQLNVDMPVDALKYWVLGIYDPRQPFQELDDGFVQAGWMVRYREMQRVDVELLPRKLNAEKEKTSLKLVVDRWDLS